MTQSASSAAVDFDGLSPDAQIIALRAQLAEVERENNDLRVEVESAIAERADAAQVRQRYDALRNSTLGKVTTRYWGVRRGLRRAK